MNYLAKIVNMVGTVDGSNRDFTTPSAEAFIENSEVVFVRGLPRVKTWDDGWVVIDASAGEVRLNEAPLTGDAVAMLYAVEIADAVQEVEELNGVISSFDDVVGSIDDPDELTGTTEAVGVLDGSLEDPEPLDGVVNERNEISGVIEVCG